MKRVKTGIKGFDELIKGGFPVSNTILLTGSPGTGKTIFGIQYIHYGALKCNEKGMIVTFEQTKENIINQAKLFGWDLEKMISDGKITILYIPTRKIDKDTASFIVDKIVKGGIQRLVIDSISTLSVNAPIYTFVTDSALIDISKGKSFFSPPVMGDFIVKRFLYTFIDDLRNVDHCTTILISESSEKGEYLSRDTISEFVCDGVIQVTFESMGGEFSRSLIVRKMRHTKNDEDIHPLEINDKSGLIVHSIEK